METDTFSLMMLLKIVVILKVQRKYGELENYELVIRGRFAEAQSFISSKRFAVFPATYSHIIFFEHNQALRQVLSYWRFAVGWNG